MAIVTQKEVYFLPMPEGRGIRAIIKDENCRRRRGMHLLLLVLLILAIVLILVGALIGIMTFYKSRAVHADRLPGE